MLGSASPSAFLRLATFLADDHYAFLSQLTLDKIARVLKSLTQATKSRESISRTTKHALIVVDLVLKNSGQLPLVGPRECPNGDRISRL
ncbi:hypothetical protein HCBG_07064 [Histoplasma capsulatum G186AR]|uniref:Uncharacterized protein n=1 Tax=Ajellomyces capsulatus (strain G186AR / H82 / ATCC MYA-2454 / RMSCC 2432) TaxID=447093 RepID=C0NV84_AJECG|nr:uncharacterized protein HCBG_07064 [Histoplasma capsulatum G186AR]EEH04423.1 hypothetical protein HCBG_07064 [Histoplasma capsulatum G186AR]